MKKIGYFFFSFLPLIASVSLQFVVSIPAMGLSFIQICYTAVFAGQKLSYEELTTELTSAWTNTDFSAWISILFALCTILLFSFWYTKPFHGNLKPSPQSQVHPISILGLILLVPGLQFVSSILTSLSATLFPGWMDFYEKLMETSGLTGEPSVIMIFYAVLLGPIGEELVFRGVTLASAKKALPFWAANLLQAFLFGVFHLNVIQGIYAFFIGIFLGYVCGRGGSIYLSIFLHILFNAWGTLIPTDSVLYTNPILSGIFWIGSIFLGILGFFLFHHGTNSHKNRGVFSA